MAAPMPNTLSAVDPVATIIPFPTRPWWATAPNPACVDWCEVQHDPTEFATSASFVCERIIADDERFLVLARSTVRAEQAAGVLSPPRSGPFVNFRLHEPTDADMLELLSAHCQASVVCETATGC